MEFVRRAVGGEYFGKGGTLRDIGLMEGPLIQS